MCNKGLFSSNFQHIFLFLITFLHLLLWKLPQGLSIIFQPPILKVNATCLAFCCISTSLLVTSSFILVYCYITTPKFYGLKKPFYHISEIFCFRNLDKALLGDSSVSCNVNWGHLLTFTWQIDLSRRFKMASLTHMAQKIWHSLNHSPTCVSNLAGIG